MQRPVALTGQQRPPIILNERLDPPLTIPHFSTKQRILDSAEALWGEAPKTALAAGEA